MIIGWGNMCRPTFFLRTRPTTSQTQSPLQVQRAKGGQTGGLVTPIGWQVVVTKEAKRASFQNPFQSVPPFLCFPFLCNLPSPLPTLLQQYLCTGGWSVGPAPLCFHSLRPSQNSSKVPWIPHQVAASQKLPAASR